MRKVILAMIGVMLLLTACARNGEALPVDADMEAIPSIEEEIPTPYAGDVLQDSESPTETEEIEAIENDALSAFTRFEGIVIEIHENHSRDIITVESSDGERRIFSLGNNALMLSDNSSYVVEEGANAIIFSRRVFTSDPPIYGAAVWVASDFTGALDDVTLMNDGTPVFSQRPITARTARFITGLSFQESAPFELSHLAYLSVTYVNFDGESKVGSMIVAAEIADEVLDIFREIYESRFPIYSIRLIDYFGAMDYYSLAANNTSAFNFRYIAGTRTLSRHALGMAIDINPIQNPYLRGNTLKPEAGREYLDRDNIRTGMITRGDAVYNAFISRGWIWGGNWVTLRDYHHFERRDTPPPLPEPAEENELCNCGLFYARDTIRQPTTPPIMIEESPTEEFLSQFENIYNFTHIECICCQHDGRYDQIIIWTEAPIRDFSFVSLGHTWLLGPMYYFYTAETLFTINNFAQGDAFLLNVNFFHYLIPRGGLVFTDENGNRRHMLIQESMEGGCHPRYGLGFFNDRTAIESSTNSINPNPAQQEILTQLLGDFDLGEISTMRSYQDDREEFLFRVVNYDHRATFYGTWGTQQGAFSNAAADLIEKGYVSWAWSITHPTQAGDAILVHSERFNGTWLIIDVGLDDASSWRDLVVVNLSNIF
ncbi:MAG: M15 family metallopeptidase [Defluviitaleaceae bacterium]|nr:M15 family metallopeptidase [Defluviitaleaceae bacterium]